MHVLRERVQKLVPLSLARVGYELFSSRKGLKC